MKKNKKKIIKKYPAAHGIKLKKQYGQHFLRDYSVVEAITNEIDLSNKSIFEIGPGDGFLTKVILEKNIQRLWCFEIDSDWVAYLHKTINDSRCSVFHANILDTDFELFNEYAPWILLSNLPYQVTFPILHKLQQHRSMLLEGVIMVQEEVAQKIIKKEGRGYGFISLYFQHFFEWKLLNKIAPEAFEPPPKVNSRLLYFKPKFPQEIPEEEKFWKFIKLCFTSPRRTINNNLRTTHYDIQKIPEKILNLRAQQLAMSDLLSIWELIRK